jgi:hypothetical protein
VGSQGGDDTVNAIVRLPPGITETQSYTWVLREQFIATLAPFFSGFTILRNNQVTIQRGQLPVLGVYILPEKMTPDGDANASYIRFTHNFQIGFSIIIANNDPDIAEQKLDAAWWSLMNGLWRDQSLMRMFNSGNPDDTRIEGVVAGIRRFVYGTIGKNNETPVAELQYEVNCTYRTEWAPVITDTLDKIVVTVIPSGFDAAKTQTVLVEYDFAATG